MPKNELAVSQKAELEAPQENKVSAAEDYDALIQRRNELNKRLNEINAEINVDEAVAKIFDAIGKQRFYCFNNEPKWFLDINTGLMWAHLDYYDYCPGHDKSSYYPACKKYEMPKFNTGRFGGWDNPSVAEARTLVDSNFPCSKYVKDSRIRVQGYTNGYYNEVFIKDGGVSYNYVHYLFPCSSAIKNKYDSWNYNKLNLSGEVQKKFIVKVFCDNQLKPQFDDAAVSELFEIVYYKIPKLKQELKDIENKLSQAQIVERLSGSFDYRPLLDSYDLDAIGKSVIKYHKAVQGWTEMLLEKLEYYEKDDVAEQFKLAAAPLAAKYKPSNLLSDEENKLLSDRHAFFAGHLSLGMTDVKTRLIAVKQQALDLECRIDEISRGTDAIHSLALLEKEDRASFELIAEFTAEFITDALRKIDFFAEHKEYVIWLIKAIEDWTESYKLLVNSYMDEFEQDCRADSIDEEVWRAWCEDWRAKRFEIEKSFQPIVERELSRSIETTESTEKAVAEQIIAALEEYKNEVDEFFEKDRKGVYQNYALQVGGELQDRIETEMRLYKITAKLQANLQDIIFSCKHSEDRIFILNWANKLLDLQIDSVVNTIAASADTELTSDILNQFAELKQKNYDVYLADAKSYAAAQAERDKKFNSLVFRMRKDAAKK